MREDAPSPTVTDVLRFEKGFPSQRRSAEEMGEELQRRGAGRLGRKVSQYQKVK